MSNQLPGTLYHLSPVGNRESIRANGLDWRKMSGLPGLASLTGDPDSNGIWLAELSDIEALAETVRIHNETLDLWAVRAHGLKLDANRGWYLCSEPLAPERLRLVREISEDVHRSGRETPEPEIPLTEFRLEKKQ